MRLRIGMRIAGESENYGTGQERLNNVFGARLRIICLRASRGGPGIEFLEYLAPRTGRPVPDDLRPNDLAYWQTRVVVADANRAAESSLALKYSFVSSGTVSVNPNQIRFAKGFLVRDPDGHALQLVEK